MKRYFITGLVLIVPFTLAILLTGWIFYILSVPFFAIYHAFFGSILLSRLLSMITVFFVFIMTGFFAQYYIVKLALEWVHRLMQRVPLVKSIYHATYEVVAVLSREDEKGFSVPVLVDHPSPTCKIIGFIPRKDVELCTSLTKKPLIPVFIPGTVNPLMGFLAFVDSDYVKQLTISTKEAFIWNISLGGKSPTEWQ